MKKLVIGSLVGAVIIYVWSMFSWVVSPIHLHTTMYTPAQDSILTALAALGQSGAYAMPMIDNRNVHGFDTEYQKKSWEFYETSTGKPAAMIFYWKEGMAMSTAMQIIGFLSNWAVAFFLCVIIAACGPNAKTFFMRWWIAMLPAWIVIAGALLPEWNWMGYGWDYISGTVLDIVVSFGLCGAWLAWWLGRK